MNNPNITQARVINQRVLNRFKEQFPNDERFDSEFSKRYIYLCFHEEFRQVPADELPEVTAWFALNVAISGQKIADMMISKLMEGGK
jgi:hypothetical protein